MRLDLAEVYTMMGMMGSYKGVVEMLEPASIERVCMVGFCDAQTDTKNHVALHKHVKDATEQPCALLKSLAADYPDNDAAFLVASVFYGTAP